MTEAGADSTERLTAGKLAATRVPRAAPPARAGDVLRELVGGSFESLANVAVVEGARLVGVVPVEALVAAPADTALGDLVTEPPATVPAEADQEQAGLQAALSPTSTTAVLDENGDFAGLIPADRLLPILLQEHEEDLARLSGVVASQSEAREALEEPVPRRLWHRVPWLVIGLFGAMTSALIVASFEPELEREVLLAFFVPAIVYMADAVGTQTETVVIRGLSVGVKLKRVAWVELATGQLIGVLIATLFFAFVLLFWGQLDVALSVALALFASVSAATAIAMALPYLLNRLGFDPAYGSGPLATVIQDLFSILVYFLIASALVD
jgi:magnesium transporter